MTKDLFRYAVVEEAISWLGTPYHPQARIKGLGVDCAMFPSAVYEAVGLIPRIEPTYTQDWMMHRDEEKFLEFVTPYAREITREEAGPGDFVIWKFGRTYSHSAIIVDLPEVIHAVIKGGAVIRADMDTDVDLIDRPVKFYTVFGD